MYCITLKNNHEKTISSLGYVPVGLGKNITSDLFIRDNSKLNISSKNDFYGEYTFHYWLWKNYLESHDGEWFGFCHYRKFWSLKHYNSKEINFNSLNDLVLKEIPEKYEEYETILGEPFFVNQFRGTKFIKKGMKIFLKNPLLLFDEKRRTLNYHFDLMHGENNLKKAIDLLDKENQNDWNKPPPMKNEKDEISCS